MSLAERFGGRTVTREIFAAMVEDVAVRLKAFDGRDRLAHVLASPNFHLLGTSGTVTTLAGVHLDLERYDRPASMGCGWIATVSTAWSKNWSAGISSSASPIPASAPIVPTWCSPAAPYWKRSALSGHRSGCASPTAACARAY
ncbi:hypothetical protein AJ88_06920 [Mesorhizobium amorphae CCBAU 01583]|nr:hypothetical protein AJ88_06920 [Mesorhizobium amorphae CCBAU 01583]